MKTKILKTSFRLFSFLAEKTGGWRIFVRPKMWLGIIIVSSVTSCAIVPDPEQETTCYDPVEVTCYLVGPPSGE